MKVSVIIPSYNRGDLLGDAIESVLAQSLPPHEVIVIDDGSSDDTEGAIARYADRIRFIRQPNAGVGAARNRGVCEASGQWVAFLDSDDCWLPHFIADCAAAARADPAAAVVYTTALRWSGQRPLPGGLVGEAAGSRPLERLLRLRTLCTSSSVVIDRALLLRVGAFDEDRELGPSADWDCWTRLALAGARFAYSSRPAALIRVHPSNMLSDPARMETAMLRAMQRFVQLLPEAERAPMSRLLTARVAVRSAVAFYGIGDVATARRHLLSAVLQAPSVALSDCAWSWTLLRSLLGARLSQRLRRLKYRNVSR